MVTNIMRFGEKIGTFSDLEDVVKRLMKTYLCINCLWQETTKKTPEKCPECGHQVVEMK